MTTTGARNNQVWALVAFVFVAIVVVELLVRLKRSIPSRGR